MNPLWLYEKEGADWRDPRGLIAKIWNLLTEFGDDPNENLCSLLANLQIHHQGWEGELLRKGVKLGGAFVYSSEVFTLLYACDRRAFTGEFTETMWFAALSDRYSKEIFERVDKLCGRPKTIMGTSFEWYMHRCACWSEEKLKRFSIKSEYSAPIEPKFVAALLATAETPARDMRDRNRDRWIGGYFRPGVYALKESLFDPDFTTADEKALNFFLRWILLEMDDDHLRRLHLHVNSHQAPITDANRAWYKWRMLSNELFEIWQHVALRSSSAQAFETVEALFARVVPGVQEDPAFRNQVENGLLAFTSASATQCVRVVESATRLLGAKPRLPLMRRNSSGIPRGPANPKSPFIAEALRE